MIRPIETLDPGLRRDDRLEGSGKNTPESVQANIQARAND